jgi:hypothetical protein
MHQTSFGSRGSESIGNGTAYPAPSAFLSHDEFVAHQDVANGAVCWKSNIEVLSREHLVKLLGSPCRMLLSELHDECRHFHGRPVGNRYGDPALVGQPNRAEQIEPPGELVPSLATDPELSTEVGHPFAVAQTS